MGAAAPSYVACYNCTGANSKYECGLPMYGCDLCKMHGNSFGKLLTEFSKQPVTIGGIVFTPPTYQCLECKDSGEYSYKFWDTKLEDHSMSDGRSLWMPRAQVACKVCHRIKHWIQLERAKRNYEVLVKAQDVGQLRALYFEHMRDDDFERVLQVLKLPATEPQSV